MKIALLTDGIYPFYVGGMQMHSFYMAKKFAENKIYVDLYHPIINGTEEDFLQIFSINEKHYITLYFVKFPSKKYFPGHYIYESYLYSRNIYKRFVQNKKCDFIYAQGFTAWAFCVFKQKHKIPKIGVNFHGLNMFQTNFGIKGFLHNILFKPFVKYILKNSDLIFSLGGRLTDIIKQKVGSDVSIVEIPVGIDEIWVSNQIRISSSVEKKFVFIGRYDRIKGIGLLNEAINHLNEKGVTFVFNFIGNIPLAKQLKEKNVNYFGQIKDQNKIKTILTESDIIVSSSFSEGMPISILEGMSCGLAVIATDVGAVREQVSSANGILIKPGHSLEIEKAMEQMCYIDSNVLSCMKRESLRIVKERFLWDNVIELTIKAIDVEIKES